MPAPQRLIYAPKPPRSAHRPRPRPAPVVDFHVIGCDCPDCEPYVPSIVPGLSGRTIAALTSAGFVTATAIATAIDPVGTRQVLGDLFGFWFL